MADTFRFPNDGYEVTVCKKHDILACIDENIVDKDIALAIVEQCEKDAANFINEGRWTGLPFIGSVRIPKHKQLQISPEQQELIKEAKENLSTEQYIVFRRNLSTENKIQAKNERYYNYIVSMAINRNRKLYKKLCSEKGEVYARIYLFASKHIVALNNEYVNIKENE